MAFNDEELNQIYERTSGYCHQGGVQHRRGKGQEC